MFYQKVKDVKNLLIKNAKLITQDTIADDLVDILILQGKIAQIGQLSSSYTSDIKLVDLAGKYYVSAGWIDIHTHCFPASPIYHDEPDLVGVLAGVTTVVDAGSVGANDLEKFFDLAIKAKTNVFAFINISQVGLISQNELSDMNNISDTALFRAYKKYPQFIIGLKARMSSSVVGDNDIKPLYRAKEMQALLANTVMEQTLTTEPVKKHPLPIMVHIGNNPPDLDAIADLMNEGDIVTHCFHGKPNKILDNNGQLKASIRRATTRGVILDVGHGAASFSFKVAEQAIRIGVYPDIISTDIYYRNRINGPVYSLAMVLDKFLMMGLTLNQLIGSVTSKPSKLLNLSNKGRIAHGCDGDLTIFELKNKPIELVDSEGEKRISQHQIVAVAAVVAGEWILTTQGKSYHDFK